MLTAEQQYVLSLLRHALVLGGCAEGAESLETFTVVNYVQRNGILLTVYPALAADSPAKQILQNEYLANIAQHVNQEYEGKRVIKALGEAGLRCVPLKGWDIRELYPHSTMRQMTDVDLLVEEFDFSRVCDVMTSLGFRAIDGDESYYKHDVFCKGSVTFEIHKRMMDETGPVNQWEAGVWGRLVCSDDGWHMSAEDRYVLHFVHMGHDFKNGWFGLRRIVDVWLLEQGREGLDEEYVNRMLVSMGLLEFRDHMVALAQVVMGEKEPSDDDELLLDYAFGTGIYGNGVSHKAARVAMMSKGSVLLGSLRSKVAAVFLPYGRMKAQFPVLERWPVLLPVCWVRRIVRFLGSKNLQTYRSMLDYSNVSKEDVENMRKVQHAGGF